MNNINKELSTNPRSGLLLLKDLGGLYSKMNNVSLYFYNMILTKENNTDLSHIFRNINIEETKHMELLADMCYQLGVDPRLWDIQHDLLQYWSPGYNIYPRTIHKMIENMINNEMKLIEIMQSQLSMIDEPMIINIFQQIIEEDKIHVDILKARLY
ncbi:MAG: hypothetical protein LUG12_08300 [Erysipelotrichaceae bacterium]|nr:hypothetical protein [Erysipelotrichaceae bacterium]